MRRLNERVVCSDGFSFSCQANENAYCLPRKSSCNHYTHVEVGFPSQPEQLILEYREDGCKNKVTKSVYPYVPSEIVHIMITKHGGIKSGEVPKGVPVFGYTHKKRE